MTEMIRKALFEAEKYIGDRSAGSAGFWDVLEPARVELSALTALPDDVARDVEKVNEAIDSLASCAPEPHHTTTAQDAGLALSRLATAAARGRMSLEQVEAISTALGALPGETLVESATRVATAAARVPALDDARKAYRQRAYTAESERDAARGLTRLAADERDAAQQQVDALLSIVGTGLDYTPTRENVEAALRGIIASGKESEQEVASLTARVAELEGERKSLDLRVCTGEQNLSSANRTILYANENGARASAERDRAEARATAAEAKVTAIESAVVATVGGQVEGLPTSPVNYLQRLRALVAAESQPTPAPGLREAVGEVLVALESAGGLDGMLRITPWDKTSRTTVPMNATVVRALRAAYDATPPAVTACPCTGGYACQPGTGGCGAKGAESAPSLPATRAALAYLGSLSIGRPNAVEESRLYWAAMDELGNSQSTPEPTVTLAALAAVVEGPTGDFCTAYLRAAAAPVTGVEPVGLRAVLREVLRRVTGGQVPEVLPKARVVEVLTIPLGMSFCPTCGFADHSPGDDGATPFCNECDDECGSSDETSEEVQKEIARRLGLTLPTGPGGGETCEYCTGPSSSGNGEPIEAEECDEHREPAQRARIPTPTPGHVEPVTLGKGPFVLLPDVASRAVERTHRTVTEAQPEPAAPEVLFEQDRVRVLADGTTQWRNGSGEWRPTSLRIVGGLARALAEAKREVRKAAEDMRERAAVQALRHTDVVSAADGIRALPLE